MGPGCLGTGRLMVVMVAISFEHGFLSTCADIFPRLKGFLWWDGANPGLDCARPSIVPTMRGIEPTFLSAMGAEKLKQSLQGMTETGPSGFEGLVKRFLELILNEPFVLARAGDQPSGDAHNSRRNVCVQAKRYSGTSPNAKNIEGDFDESLRELPMTDVYVIAVTRSTAQLDDTLDAMREKSAVDVVVWDFADDNSALLVLCVEFWSDIQEFAPLRTLDAEINHWILARRGSSRHKERLACLKLEIRECTHTLASIREAARTYLERRFQLASGTAPLSLHAIRLSTAVDRPAYRKDAIEWWRSKKSRLAILNASEGNGKTWVAAQCAQAISEQEEGIVLWLDSLQWHACTSVDAVLAEAISRLGIGDAQKVDRLVRKLRDRWSGRTLIVLDGASERNAFPAAQKVIEDLSSKHPGACRILLTTRPLDNSRGFDPSLWNHWTRIPVKPFDDSELSAALAQANIPPSELSEQIREVARIPRYFTTCLRLRDRLRQFGNISVALVLWTDLLDKINGLEPAIREALGFTSESDAVEVMVKLATSLPDAVARGQAQELLNSCFGGKYHEIRNYLKEIRIMEKAGVFEATLNREHTILGRALFIQQVLHSLSPYEIRDAADRLLEALEPLAAEDGGAEALFVALQLTAMRDDSQADGVSRQRTVLLYAWLISQNSNASDERLAFWCSYDIDAYAQVVATFFEQLYSANSQEFIVKPLARLWRAGGSPAFALKPILRRWLLLCWFEGCSGTELAYRGHRLPIAKSADQVRLAALAVSLLSLRSDPSFLPDLALCLATEELSWRKIQTHRSQFKSIFDNIGVLMRWHYTERVLPEMDRMARECEYDELLLDGFRWLAHTLQIIDVPAILRLPPQDISQPYFGTPAIELIREGHRVFNCPRTGPYPNQIDFSHLAVRSDLPQLSNEDVEHVCRAVKEALTKDSLLEVVCAIQDRHLDALWPWHANFFPMDLATIAGNMQLSALKEGKSDQAQCVFWFLNGVLPKLDDKALLEWERLANAKARSAKVAKRGLEDYIGLSIAEAALLLLPEESVHRWVLASAQDEGRRYSMCFDPIGDLISLVLPNLTRHLAAEKCLALGDGQLRSGIGPPTELQYWCYIAGLTTGPNEKLYDWSRNRILETLEGAQPNLSLLSVWLRSAPAGRLEADLDSSIAGKLFNKAALRAWAVGGNLNFDGMLLRGSYDELMRNLPQGFVGGLFAQHDRDADLKRWGQELFAFAIKHLGKPPFERRSQRRTYIRLGNNRMVRRVGFEDEAPASYKWSIYANFWGVDSGNPSSALSGRQARQELLDVELDRWCLDEDQLQKWEGYEMHAFGAWSALEKWSKLHPEEFLPRARVVLDEVINNPATEFHLGGFVYAVACCLLPTAPEEAADYFIALNYGELGITVQSSYAVPEFYTVLWDLNLCTLPAHEKLRRQLFTNSLNEFEVMVLSVAALANHAENHLGEIAYEYLEHKTARVRALGVSILGWIGTEKSANRLVQIAETDPSRWVRDHAKWASEVASQEMSSRSYFRRLLHETDPYRVSAGLQVLKPALTPLARWWSTEILNEEENSGLVLAPKIAAISKSFWHHQWATSVTSSVCACGRKLDEVCRGEHLDQLKSPKLAPWWAP